MEFKKTVEGSAAGSNNYVLTKKMDSNDNYAENEVYRKFSMPFRWMNILMWFHSLVDVTLDSIDRCYLLYKHRMLSQVKWQGKAY